jgi:hypothetical protein
LVNRILTMYLCMCRLLQYDNSLLRALALTSLIQRFNGGL